MTALASRLLACPFCGSDAEMDTDQSFRAFVSGRFESSVAIYCTKCCVQMQHCYSDHRGTEREDLAADLIERWNTREAAAALSVPEGREAVAEVHVGADSVDLRWVSNEAKHSFDGRIGAHPLYTTPQPGDGWSEQLAAMVQDLRTGARLHVSSSAMADAIESVLYDAAPSAKGVV